MSLTHTPTLTVAEETTVARTVHIYESQLRALESLARRNRRSVTFMVREVLQAGLDAIAAPESR